MSNAWKWLVACFTVVVLAFCLGAQETEKKPAPKKGGRAGILHPELTVEKGSYDKPMGNLGEKPAQPWSATTVGAAINGKPNPGRERTLVGEIVDFSCYLQVGKHGEKHRDCGQKCVNNGEPIGLLTQDGQLYMLMAEEHDPRRDGQTTFRKAANDHMGHIMEVTGTESTVRGYHALYVTGYAKK